MESIGASRESDTVEPVKKLASEAKEKISTTAKEVCSRRLADALSDLAEVGLGAAGGGCWKEGLSKPPTWPDINVSGQKWVGLVTFQRASSLWFPLLCRMSRWSLKDPTKTQKAFLSPNLSQELARLEGFANTSAYEGLRGRGTIQKGKWQRSMKRIGRVTQTEAQRNQSPSCLEETLSLSL